jgi:hypothetical protein
MELIGGYWLCFVLFIIIIIIIDLLLTNYYRGDPIKKNEMAGARGTYRRDRHNLQERKPL